MVHVAFAAFVAALLNRVSGERAKHDEVAIQRDDSGSSDVVSGLGESKSEVDKIDVNLTGLKLEESSDVWASSWKMLKMPAVDNYAEVRRLGAGSFGVVYEARDTTTGETVAIKFFKKSNGFLSWKGATRDQRDKLSQASNECKRVQRIHESDNANLDPAGASRLTRCIDDQVAARKDTDRIVYLVQEPGRFELSEYLKDQRTHKHVDYSAARVFALELMQGLKLLASFHPPYIHHDLKPDNIVYKHALPADPQLQVIDFGGMFRACTDGMSKDEKKFCTTGKQSTWWGNTEAWRPPEFNYGGFVTPPSSFDMFAAGLIYMQLLCPQNQVEYPPWPAKIKAGTIHKNNIILFLEPCLQKKDSSFIQIDDSEIDLLALMLSSSMHKDDAIACAKKRPTPDQVLPVLQDLANGQTGTARLKVADMHRGHSAKLRGCHKVGV